MRATNRPFLRFLHIVLLLESVSYVESIRKGSPNPSPSANSSPRSSISVHFSPLYNIKLLKIINNNSVPVLTPPCAARVDRGYGRGYYWGRLGIGTNRYPRSWYNVNIIHKLTHRAIKNAGPNPRKDYRLSDGGGLYLLVTTSGSKLWRWSYEFNRKEKLLSYGPYPAVTLAQARKLHAEAQALKRQGIDPAAEKQSRKRGEQETERAASMPTFAELTEEWLSTWGAKRSKRYVGTVKTRLDRDILPVIGTIRLDQLKPSEMAKIATGIQDEREAADLARRALQKMKQIMRFAVAHGYIERNPIAEILPGDLLKAHTVENFSRIEPIQSLGV